MQSETSDSAPRIPEEVKCYNPTDGEYCKTIDTSAELGNTSIVPQML